MRRGDDKSRTVGPMAKTTCEKRAANRKAAKKYVAGNKKAHAASVKKSEAKAKATKPATGDKATASKAPKAAAKAGKDSPGIGKHGHKMGRPRKAC